MAFADFSTNNFQLTAFGNAQISTSVKKYGDGSALFDGTGDYVQTPNLFDFASQDWTIEFWLYANTQTDKHIIANVGSGQDGINIYIDGSSNITYNNGNTTTSVGASYTSYWNQWTHIALVRSGSTISMYVNGTLAGTPTTQTPGSNQFLYIGKSGYTGYDFTGYIDDLRITKGIARYTANFTPPQQQLPTTTDPYFSNVSLLLPMNLGPFKDSSTNNFELTAFGNADLSTAVKKYGTASVYFDGSGDYVIVPNSNAFSFGTDDFTVELWVYMISVPRYIICNGIGPNGGPPTTTTAWNIRIISGNLQFERFDGTNESIVDFGSWSPNTNTWYHIAISRQSSTIRAFINGVLLAQQSDSTNYSNINQIDPLRIGYTFDGAPPNDHYFNGYIDDLRITKGVARYTSNFTPPQQQLPKPSDPYQDNVSLLLHMDNNQFVDASYNNFTITPFGNARSSTQVVKYGDTAAYFDGNGDYITAPNNTALNFNTTDNFTVEGWIYFNSLEDGVALVSKGSNATNSGWILYYFSNTLYFGRPYVANDISGSFTPSLSTWYHLACTRNSGTIRLFVDGSQIASSTGNSFNYTTTEDLRVGYSHSNNFLNGYVDDIRITKGVARYTTTFTPPSAQLPTFTDPDFANVSLLLQTNRPFTDSSSNNFTLSAFGNAQISTSVKKFGSGSGYFDGTGDYLMAYTNQEFGTNNWTTEFWFRAESISGEPRMLSKQDAGTGFVYQLRIFNNSPELLIRRGDGSGFQIIGGATTISINQWYHIAIVRNGNTISMYIDGTLSASATFTGTYDSLFNAPWVIGAFSDSSINPQLYFQGYIDELRITKGVARYTSNFVPHTAPFVNPPPIPSGYLAFWKLADLTDSSPNGNNLVNTNNVQFVAGKIGDCAQFPGNNSTYLQNNSLSSPFNPNGPAGEFTISCWVFPQSFSNYQAFLGSTDSGFIIHTDSGGNLYCNEARFGDAQVNSILQLNQWQHIVFVKSVASGNRTKIWYNGTKVYDQPTNNINNYQSKTNVTLGNHGGLNFPYNGKLDMVGLWNRELTQSEIDLLYNNGNGKEP